MNSVCIWARRRIQSLMSVVARIARLDRDDHRDRRHARASSDALQVSAAAAPDSHAGSGLRLANAVRWLDLTLINPPFRFWGNPHRRLGRTRLASDTTGCCRSPCAPSSLAASFFSIDRPSMLPRGRHGLQLQAQFLLVMLLACTAVIQAFFVGGPRCVGFNSMLRFRWE